MLVRFPVDPHLVAQQIGFPCVIKLLVSWLDRSQSLILQQYIGTRPGKDLRVWVIGSQVIGAMLRSSTDGSFKANISRGGDGQAFPLDPELERLARDSAAALNLDIAGVDLLFDRDGYSICEVNSAPGFQGFETATGLNVARLVLEHCKSTMHLSPPKLACVF
ncbi:MAG: hypothetical protein NWP84_07070 [Cyanobium sp. MAG_04]|nr:hypothetical protein [Cyanobium sp. MAG_04]